MSQCLPSWTRATWVADSRARAIPPNGRSPNGRYPSTTLPHPDARNPLLPIRAHCRRWRAPLAGLSGATCAYAANGGAYPMLLSRPVVLLHAGTSTRTRPHRCRRAAQSKSSPLRCTPHPVTRHARQPTFRSSRMVLSVGCLPAAGNRPPTSRPIGLTQTLGRSRLSTETHFNSNALDAGPRYACPVRAGHCDSNCRTTPHVASSRRWRRTSCRLVAAPPFRVGMLGCVAGGSATSIDFAARNIVLAGINSS